MNKETNKERKIGLILSVVTVLVAALAVSLAIFVFQGAGARANTITTGTLVLEMDESTTEGITIQNAFPVSDIEGQAFAPYTFTIRNTGTIPVTYQLKLIDDEQAYIDFGSLNRRLPHANIRHSITVDGGSPITSTLSTSSGILDTRNLAAGEEVVYNLRVWIALASTNEIMGQRFHGMLELSAVQQGDTYFD